MGHGGRGGGHAVSPASWCRQKPERMAVGAPVLTQEPERGRWQGHIPVFSPFPTPDMDEHARTIHIRHLEVRAFLEAEAAGVDSTQARPRTEEVQVGQHGTHCFQAEDDGEFLLPWGADTGQRGPLPFEGVLVEELDAAQRNGAGAPRVVLDVFDIEEIVTEFLLHNLVRGFVVMFRQLADGSDRHLLGAFRHAAELQSFDHPLAQSGHDDTSST